MKSGPAHGALPSVPDGATRGVPSPTEITGRETHSSPDIFISLRFGEALAAGKALKIDLEGRGLSVFLCSVQAGGDLVDEIVYNIDRSRLVVILGTKTYGKDTGVGFCTADELKFIMSEKKSIFLVKMCDRFEEALARFRLGVNVMFYEWKPADSSQQAIIPKPLVDSIMKKFQDLRRQDHSEAYEPP